MAYQSNNLSVLAYANGFTLWHYATTDATTTVDTSGYFNTATDMLRTGDIIVANVSTDTTPAAGLFRIASNTNGVVDVADMTGIGATNTD